MFQKKSFPLISCIILKDILLYLVIALGLTLLAEIILPGFVASKIRFFDIIVLIAGVIFALVFLQNKFPQIQKIESQEVYPSFSNSKTNLIFLSLFAFLVFLSATYKYTLFEIIILLLGTIALFVYGYRVFFREPN